MHSHIICIVQFVLFFVFLMTLAQEDNLIQFDTKGKRLGHFLDVIGFKPGHGRVSTFHKYISSQLPETFPDLKYETVKGWFKDNAPVVSKIDQILFALKSDYQFDTDPVEVRTWWKMGGAYPFTNSKKETSASNKFVEPSSATINRDLKIGWDAMEVLLKLAKEEDIADVLSFCDKEVIQGYLSAVDELAHQQNERTINTALLENLLRIEINRVRRS